MSLGRLEIDRQDWAAAIEHYERALDRYRQVEDLQGQGQALFALGVVYAFRGRAGGMSWGISSKPVKPPC
jgi:uncharacterized protein HemY